MASIKHRPAVGAHHKASSRGTLRLLAALANSAMVLWIYAVHLWEFEWNRRAAGQRSLVDYLWLRELEPAFEYLRVLSFSDAMLSNLNIYMLVGTPVSIAYFILERDRIRWLQTLVMQYSPRDEVKFAVWCLEAYLWTVSTTFVAVVLLSVCHIELPMAHYICAAIAFSFGFTSVCLALLTPIDYSALAANAAKACNGCDERLDCDFAVWAMRLQSRVKPALMFVVVLHVVALAAGLWKIQCLHDTRAALVFGVAETATVLGYQLFIGIFSVDDAMVGRGISNIPRKI